MDPNGLDAEDVPAEAEWSYTSSGFESSFDDGSRGTTTGPLAAAGCLAPGEWEISGSFNFYQPDGSTQRLIEQAPGLAVPA